jgi:3-methyladenine DNA glycosylase/8-oxoguanine DNA glycosylase
MPRAGRDAVLRRRDGCLVRLVPAGGEDVLVHAWPAGGVVRLRAEGGCGEAAALAVERMRFALGLDHDLEPFHREFARDRLLGPTIRRRPWIRPWRAPVPFEALAWAITEQLIESERAYEIQRQLTWRHARRSACGLRSGPCPETLARRAPAELQACGLSASRAMAMVRAAREVAAGRADLTRHEPTWKRLRTISGIGAWTLEKLAFHGQGRDDQIPAGDLAYLKLVGRLLGLGRRAAEDEVREFFSPYAPHAALAGIYLLHARHELGV